MDPKSKILKLQKDSPKSCARVVEQDPVLKQWVLDNTLIGDSEKFVAKMYSAVHQVGNICPRGNTKPYKRWSTGFSGCGPASVCACTKESITKSVTESKSKVTKEQKALIQEKRENTMLERFGAKYNSQRADIKHLWSKSNLLPNVRDKLTNIEWLDHEYNVKQRSLVDIAEELGVYYSTVGDYCQQHGFKIRQRSRYSLTEKHIADFIESLGTTVLRGDWDILGTHELDIVMPDAKLAIEVDGLRWHSWNPYDARLEGKAEDRYRHIRKTQLASEKGYQLLHITDFDWKHKEEKVKDIIKTKLGLNTRIPARKCKVVNVTTSAAREFIDAYHLQGFTGSSYYYGLEYNNELVMILTLKKSRYDKSDSIEIIRVCSKHGYSVVGGLSKLLSHSLKNHKGYDIVTYCDAGISNASGYINAGMQLVDLGKPGYFWTDGNCVISRFQCQAKNLCKWLPNYNSSQSESENMFREKYRRFWNCGNYKLIYKNTP